LRTPQLSLSRIAVVRGMMMPVWMVLDASLRFITVQMRQEIPFVVMRTLADAERAHIIATLRETTGSSVDGTVLLQYSG
jgi:hypothetical protein